MTIKIGNKTYAVALITLILLMEISLLVPLKSLCIQNNKFNIINVIYRSSSGSLKIYPGSKRVSLKIEAMYTGNETAKSVTGCLKTVQGIEISSGSGSCAPAKSLNGSMTLGVNKGDHVTFDYYLDILESLNPGTYNLELNITYRINSTLFYEGHTISIEISSYPEIDLRVIDAYLSPASYPGSVNTNLYILMENIGESAIVSADLEVSLPSGFIVDNAKVRIGAVNVNERFTVTFSGISIPLDASKGLYTAHISIDATLRTDDNVNYEETTLIRAQFEVTAPPKEEPIIVSSLAVLYQGSPAPLLPSARGVTIRVTLANRLSETISAIIVSPNLPSAFTLRSISGTYVNGMPPGGSCFIDIVADVDSNIDYGIYSISLNLTYIRIVSGASYMAEQNLDVQVFVESPHSYVPEITLVSAYWGSPNPSPVYEGAKYVPLTLRFTNDGRYDIIGGIVRAHSQHLEGVKDFEALAARLVPGSSGSVTLYFNVETGLNEVPINISVNYVFSEFGAHIEVSRSFEVYLPVEENPASTSNMEVISYGWQNNYNVFPNTTDAVYEVTVANRAPFSASGIKLTLKLPENMTSNGHEEADAYVDGPVRSLATFTAFFTISVGKVQPGEYNATLTIDFLLLSGGPGVRCIEEFNLPIRVNDDKYAVEFVNSRWYEGAVGPETYGAHLIVTFRNNYVDSMKGIVLELNLPSGIISAVDNSSQIKVAPVSPQALQLIQPAQISDLSRVLSQYLGASQAGSAQTFSRGDLLTFIMNLHVLNVTVGTYTAHGSLSYIDQWGTKRSVAINVPMIVLGRVEYLGIFMNESIFVRRRFTNVSLTIVNFGSSPIYDVYVIVSPYQGMPILIASPTVSYIEMIDAGGSKTMPITLAYNPTGFSSQMGGTAIINYGTTPFMVSVVYRDISGAIRRFNNTVTVIVEPFIELVIKDVRAYGTNTTASVSGTIVNYGSATAYRVEASLEVNNVSRSTFVGDVEAGSEVAFRIDVPTYANVGTLRIKYYNIFNELESKEMEISIEKQIEAPVAPPKQEGIPPEMWIVIGAVVAFLAVSAFLIYKFLRARSVGEE